MYYIIKISYFTLLYFKYYPVCLMIRFELGNYSFLI